MTAKPTKKMEIRLASGNVLRDAVNAYRATRDAAPLPDENCDKPAPTKRKSYPLPPQDQPTPIDGFPFAGQDGEPKEIPNYGVISWAPKPSTRAAQAGRLGKRAPMRPSGPSELRKKGQ
jgi:hypothetical protein